MVSSVSDFCYGSEDLAFSISESIKLCVTVVAYAPESFRRCGFTSLTANAVYQHCTVVLLNANALSYPCVFVFMRCVCARYQPTDADGAGGPGAMFSPETEEQHHDHGVSLGSAGRDRRHRRPGHLPAGPALQLRDPHTVRHTHTHTHIRASVNQIWPIMSFLTYVPSPN